MRRGISYATSDQVTRTAEYIRYKSPTPLSGKKGCSQDAPPCKLSGVCNGDLLHAEVASSHGGCQLVCQDYLGCIYYTFNYDNGVCELFEDCNRDDNHHNSMCPKSVGNVLWSRITSWHVLLKARDTF